MSDIKRNARRRKHYWMLKTAGYDRETATKYKDYDFHTVSALCKIKIEAMENVNEIDKDVSTQITSILKVKRK